MWGVALASALGTRGHVLDWILLSRLLYARASLTSPILYQLGSTRRILVVHQHVCIFMSLFCFKTKDPRSSPRLSQLGTAEGLGSAKRFVLAPVLTVPPMLLLLVCTALQSRPNRLNRGTGRFLRLLSPSGALALGATGGFVVVLAVLAYTFRPLGCGSQQACPNQTPERRRMPLRLRVLESLLSNNRCSSKQHLCRQHRWRWILRMFHSPSSAAVAVFAVAQVPPRGKWNWTSSAAGARVLLVFWNWVDRRQHCRWPREQAVQALSPAVQTQAVEKVWRASSSA